MCVHVGFAHKHFELNHFKLDSLNVQQLAGIVTVATDEL